MPGTRYGKGLWGSSKDLKRFIVGKGDVTCNLSADGKKAASTFGGTSESAAAPSCKHVTKNTPVFCNGGQVDGVRVCLTMCAAKP